MRQSPLLIAYKGISLLRNALFFYLFLFVVKKDSTMAIIELGRDMFWGAVSLSVLYVLADWWSTTFQLDAHHLTKRSGVLIRKTQQIPIAQLEQATVKRYWFHRITSTVAYTYQLADANEQLKIDMIDEKKFLLNQASSDELDNIIFRPTNKQLAKATFTSFRFLLAIPLIASLYSKVDHFVQLDPYTLKFVEHLKSDTTWQVWTVVCYIVISILCALIFTFVKYGQDCVMKEEGKLIIQKGVVNQSKMIIELDKISGVEIRQSFLKRLLGLAEIRLQFKSKDENDLQSIYPYFEYEQALTFVEGHFPQFTMAGEQQKLTKVSLIPRLFRGGLLAGFLFGVCFAVRTWLPISFYWVGLALTLIVIFGVLAAYKQFRVSFDEDRIQLRYGIFGSKLTTIQIQNVIGLEVEQSLFQRSLGIQSITVRIYADQAAEYKLKDISEDTGNDLQGGVLQKM